MARLEHYDNVYDWRWRLLIPQFCDPVWGWAMQALQIMGVVGARRHARVVGAADADDRAGQGRPRDSAERPHRHRDAGRTRSASAGTTRTSSSRRSRRRTRSSTRSGIVLDSDPRKMTQAGQLQGAAAPPTTNPAREGVDERLASLERESITTRAAVLAREPNHTTIHNQQPTTSVPVTTNVSPAPVTVIKESAPPPSKIARFGRVTKRDDKGRMLDFEIIEERKA
jgi:hypothetical protein